MGKSPEVKFKKWVCAFGPNTEKRANAPGLRVDVNGG
jgi:hypothetical protein